MTAKEEIWLKALVIVANLLEKNNCKYFFDTGTLLGAVRDKAFIPWDNDIDLSVVDCSNQDAIILKICEAMYKEGYNVTASSDEIDIFDSTGILDLGIKFYHKDNEGYWAILSKVEGSELAHSLYMSLSKNIKYKNGYHSYKLKSVISRILRLLSYLTPRIVISILLKKAEVKSNKITIPLELLHNTVPYAFYEGIFKVPENYEQYLTYRYGNWGNPNPHYNYLSDDGAITNK